MIKIYNYIKNNPNCTRRDIADAMKCRTVDIIKPINALLDGGKIKRGIFHDGGLEGCFVRDCFSIINE